MFLRCPVIILYSMFAAVTYGGTVEIIRQQFEIYQRFPGEIEILTTEDIHEIDNVLARTEVKRLAARKELDKALVERQPVKDLPSPLFAEDYTVPLVHYVAVERGFALRSLQQGKLDDTVQSIRYVYRLAEELSHAGSLELRAAAARFRLQILETAQSLLLHPHCRLEHQEALHSIFREQITRRTTDAAIWTRYQEEGKQFFRGIGTHGLGKMVSPDLLKELWDRDAFREYEKALAHRAAHDQLVFIKVSSAVIESCSVPYFQRHSVLQQLEMELREHRGVASEPVFALLLLRNVSQLMQLFAKERSGIELAYLTLSVALDKQRQEKMLNFLTGKEYEIRLIPNGVMCTYEGNVKPFYVPYQIHRRRTGGVIFRNVPPMCLVVDHRRSF